MSPLRSLFGPNPKRLFADGIKHLNAANSAWVSREFRGSSATPGEHYRAAAKCFERVVQLTPDDARAWQYLGSACYSMGCESMDRGLLRRAIECCDKAWVLAENDRDVRAEARHIAGLARGLLKP